MKNLFFLFIIIPFTVNQSTAQPATGTIDPAHTYIFMAGVLRWQSPSLTSFSDRNRKDEELYNALLATGVKEENTVYLKDDEATLTMMTTKLREILSKTTSRSYFIFYYAGHGVRAENGPVCFANYDYESTKGNGFNVTVVSEMINKFFKGKQVWLLADCCYSGSLIEEGKKIGASGKQVVTFTSSSSSNISTGNWTFTQTVIDCFAGLSFTDRNGDGKTTLGETSEELFDAMKYREKQLSGTAFFNISESTPFSLTLGKVSANVKPVEYIYIRLNNKFEPARVKSYSDDKVSGELYRYSDKILATVPVTKTKPIAFAEYPVGDKVQVEWNGRSYPAEIKETKNGFHYIHYTGYDDSWNEWVMYDRIYTSDRTKCSIEWNGQWYPGELLQQKEGRYFVHFTNYGSDWDEWVTPSRIRL